MAKITVPINNAGGTGPLKNKIYERSFVPDASLGIDKNKAYLLKRVIDYTTTSQTSITLASGSNIYLSYNLTWPNVVGPVIYFSKSSVIYALYVLNENKWVYSNNLEDLAEEDYAKLLLEGITSSSDYEALTTMITNQDGSEFIPSSYKVKNVTLGGKIADLKNWVYEQTNELGLLPIPNWDEIMYVLSTGLYEQFYSDYTNGVYMQLHREDQDRIEFSIQVQGDNYLMLNLDNSTDKVKANTWYLVDFSGFDPTYIEKSLPSFEIDYGSIGSYQLDNELFGCVYGKKPLLLKEKFEKLEQEIGQGGGDNNSILKNKTYDFIDIELENGKEYTFKENCDAFFSKYFNQAQEIYNANSSPTPISPGLLGANSTPKGATLIDEPISNDGGEEISSISFEYVNYEYYAITIFTTFNKYEYRYEAGWGVIENNDTFVPTTIENMPKLVVNMEYVENVEMLQEILNMTEKQTLEEKLSESINGWNYEKEGEPKNQPIFDLTEVFNEEYFNMLSDANLIPSGSGSVNEQLYYEEDKLVLLYSMQSGKGSSQMRASYTWLNIEGLAPNENPTDVWICNVSESGTQWLHNNQPVTSQKDLLQFDFDPTCITIYPPEIVSKLITTVQNYRTLEEKISDVANWVYESQDATLVDGETYTFKEQISLDTIPSGETTIYYDNLESTPNAVSEITINGNNRRMIVWTIPPEPDLMTEPFVYDFANNEWQDDVYQWLPQFTYNANADTVVPKLLSQILNVTGSSTTIKEKFQTCLILERLSNVAISQEDLVSDSTYQTYGYNYKAVIQDSAFIGALKVEVLFNLAQITSENFCPIQDIDTTNGTLTLYVKQNNANILLDRIDIFKNNN